MEWAALVLALVLILGLMLARALRDRPGGPPSTARRGSGRDGPDPGLTPEDTAELTREFAAAAEESSHALESLLDRRLWVLASRRVPLRAIRHAAGLPHSGRLVFADGTVLLARAQRPGELYRLALAVADGRSVTIDVWSHGPEGTALRCTWSRESADLLVLGLDQSD